MIKVQFLPLETVSDITLGLAPWFFERVFPSLLGSTHGCRLLLKYGEQIRASYLGGEVQFEKEDYTMLLAALQQSLSGTVKPDVVLVMAKHANVFYNPKELP